MIKLFSISIWLELFIEDKIVDITTRLIRDDIPIDLDVVDNDLFMFWMHWVNLTLTMIYKILPQFISTSIIPLILFIISWLKSLWITSLVVLNVCNNADHILNITKLVKNTESDFWKNINSNNNNKWIELFRKCVQHKATNYAHKLFNQLINKIDKKKDCKKWKYC